MDTRKEQLIMRLIRKDARTAIITATTRVREKVARDLKAEFTGHRPKPGKTETSDTFYFKRPHHLQSSIAASSLCSVGLHTNNSVTLESVEGGEMLCDTHDHYLSIIGAQSSPIITINRHFLLLAEHLRPGKHAMKTCSDCGAPYLVRAITPNLTDCPFCATSRPAVKSIFGIENESRKSRRRRANYAGSMAVHSLGASLGSGIR